MQSDPRLVFDCNIFNLAIYSSHIEALKIKIPNEKFKKISLILELEACKLQGGGECKKCVSIF